MTPLRPLQWLIYSPVAALPFLAALFIQGPGVQENVQANVRASLSAAGAAGWVREQVSVRDVRLTGDAPSVAAADAAVAAVRAAPGVRRVEARLRLPVPENAKRPDMLEGLLDFTGMLYLVRHHWFWIAVSLGLGVWAGWYTAIERAHYKDPEEP